MNTHETTQEVEECNWGAESWRAPDLHDGDVPLYSECGRIIKKHTYGHGDNGIDYRSHYFRIVKNWGCYLLVKHGAGQERFQLDYNPRRVEQIFEKLDSNERYLLMHMLYSVHDRARRHAREELSAIYEHAFVEGRLKKRKVRGQSRVKVWIEMKP